MQAGANKKPGVGTHQKTPNMLGPTTQLLLISSSNHAPLYPIKYATREMLERKNDPFPHILYCNNSVLNSKAIIITTWKIQQKCPLFLIFTMLFEPLKNTGFFG